MEWHTILSGIVGSTAYGLAGPDSDVDRLGFAAAPTVAFHGLHPPAGKAATREQHTPDVVVHEIGKATSLLLSANPTVSELPWLPGVLYETRTSWGDELIGIRQRLLGARKVRSAYLGYATSQFERLRNRGRFPDVPVNRIRKHARHMWRLINQGRELYVTGSMTVQIENPHLCHEFADRIVEKPEEGLQIAETMLAANAAAMDSRKSALPEQPDERAAEDWLVRTRAAFYDPSED